MAVSTALFAVATGASRLVGMLREAATAWIFSVQGEAINAFTVAYQIPNLIRSLVADAALGAAFVPIFNELLTKGERDRAWRVASTVWWLSFAGLSFVTGVAMVLAPQLLALFGYHGALGVGLARVIFPTVVILGLSGLQTAILNALDEFFLPAIAPVAWNLVIVGTLALSLPFLHTTDQRLYAYAIGILLGTAVQFAIPYPAMRRLGHLSWFCDPRDEAVQRVFVLMLPVTLGLGLINLNLLVNTFFAARVDPDIGPAAVDKAFRIYMLPQGMFSVAVAAVLFPALSRRAAAKDGPGFRGLVARGPAPDRLPADSGRRDLRRARDADRAPALRARQLHAAPDGRRRLVPRGLLAGARVQRRHAAAQPRVLQHAAGVGADLHRDREPHGQRHARLGALEPLRLGVWSIPLATSIANIFGVGLLYLELRPLAGRLDERELVRALVRIAVATVLSTAVAYGVWRGLDSLLGQFVLVQFLTLTTALVASIIVYMLAAKSMGIEELDDVLALVRRRRVKETADSG